MWDEAIFYFHLIVTLYVKTKESEEKKKAAELTIQCSANDYIKKPVNGYGRLLLDIFIYIIHNVRCYTISA